MGCSGGVGTGRARKGAELWWHSSQRGVAVGQCVRMARLEFQLPGKLGKAALGTNLRTSLTCELCPQTRCPLQGAQVLSIPGGKDAGGWVPRVFISAAGFSVPVHRAKPNPKNGAKTGIREGMHPQCGPLSSCT